MFCPQCKTEYRPGFTLCSDCGAALVHMIPVDSPRREDNTKVVAIRTFSTEFEAKLAKGLLDAAGIDSEAQGTHVRSSDFERVKGLRLVVRAEDAEDANKILETVDEG
jgi:hypothetical protein